MGRSLRLNSSSGGAASSGSSGITLDEVEDAFFTRRKLQEIAVDTAGLSAIEFTDLDTQQYDHFHIRCSRVHTSSNVTYLKYGGMEGASRLTSQSWSASGYYGTTFFSNNTSGEMYTFGSNNTFDDSYQPSSFKVIEFNLYFPDPNSGSTIPSVLVGDCTVWQADQGGYQNRSGYANWRTKIGSGALPNGFYFRPNTGNFSEDDSSPSIYTIYGTKRRKPN